MYSSYEASLKEAILSLSTEDQDKLIKLLEKKNGLSFNDDRLIAILKHLYLLDINESNNIIQKYISPKLKKNKKFKLKIKRSCNMKKLKDFFDSEIGAIIAIIFLCSIALFFGLKNL